MKLPEVNYYIYRMGAAFRRDLLVRSAFESEVFPTNQYICLSHIDQVFANPDRIRRVTQEMSPEQLGRLGRAPGQKASQIYVWLVGHEYLIGREMLYTLGELGPRDRLEDLELMLDFYTRAAAANRNDGAIQNSDVGGRHPLLDDTQVASLVDDADSLQNGSGPAFRRSVAVLEAFQFLAHADARIGIADNGPYRLPDGRSVLVKDLFDMRRNEQPYFTAVRDRLPHNALTLALVYDTLDVEINDWSTAFPREQDGNLLDAASAAAVFAVADNGEVCRVSLDEFADVAKQTRSAHRDLYRAVHELDRRERILQGALVYSRNVRPFAKRAGCDDAIDWNLTDEAVSLLPRFEADEDALNLFVQSCIRADSASAYSMIPEAS